MKTVNLQTIDNKELKIELTKHGKILRKTSYFDDSIIDVIRIFHPGEFMGNQGAVIFGTTNHDGLFLYLDEENTAILDAAFEQLGCVVAHKETHNKIG